MMFRVARQVAAVAAGLAVAGGALAQTAVQTGEQVYTVEAIGARTATGEVVAHVRAEPTSDAWAEAHGFASWEAHFLIDCRQARLKQIRGATYPERKLQGAPKPDKVSDAWIAPEPGQPGLQILGEACKPSSTRASAAELMLTPPPAAAKAPVAVAMVPASAVAATPAPTAKGRIYDLHLARGPSEDGAKRAITKARKTLAGIGGLASRVDTEGAGAERRYIAVVAGFPDGLAAWNACQTLKADGQDCYARDPEGRRIFRAPPPPGA